MTRPMLLGPALAAVLLATVARAGEPIRLHPENGHYFLWRGKPTVLVTSGEHYGAVLNLDFDYGVYLKTLAADGLNHTRVFSGTYREIPGSFNITDNTLAPKPGRDLAPWAQAGEKFDLTRWNPAYFERLRRFLDEADRQGVVVELNLFCPLYNDELWAVSPMNAANNVNGLGDCPRTEVLTLKHAPLVAIQTAVTRKIVAEANRFDNLYFEICNEPYFAGVTDAWQRRIADTIQHAERPLPKKHLISWNVANGRKQVVDPHPGVSIFNFHYCVPPDAVEMNYGLGRVIGENETGFRGSHDLLYRSEAWDFLLAGGGLYNNLDYSFTAKHPDGTFRDYRSPGGGSPELRKQLGILKRFLESFDFVRMKPGKDSIKSVSGGLAAWALAEPGRAYAVYMHVPLPNKPKDIAQYVRDKVRTDIRIDLPAGRYRAEWVDTKTGGAAAIATFAHAGGVRTLASPEFANDIALRIMATP